MANIASDDALGYVDPELWNNFITPDLPTAGMYDLNGGDPLLYNLMISGDLNISPYQGLYPEIGSPQQVAAEAFVDKYIYPAGYEAPSYPGAFVQPEIIPDNPQPQIIPGVGIIMPETPGVLPGEISPVDLTPGITGLSKVPIKSDGLYTLTDVVSAIRWAFMELVKAIGG